jgi:hypothetical protein
LAARACRAGALPAPQRWVARRLAMAEASNSAAKTRPVTT